jgi:hypothetical protein
MHLAQTRTVLTFPSITALTFCRFGKKVLFVTPVIRLPTPPFFLANPRRAMEVPACGRFPQIAQTFDMVLIPFVLSN